jgi:hypothetical protein
VYIKPNLLYNTCTNRQHKTARLMALSQSSNDGQCCRKTSSTSTHTHTHKHAHTHTHTHAHAHAARARARRTPAATPARPHAHTATVEHASPC